MMKKLTGAVDTQSVIRITARQARRLDEMIDAEPRRRFRSASRAVRFLKKDMASKR